MSTQTETGIKSYWASNVRLLRQRKGLTMETLAVDLGFTTSKMKAHEGGQTKNPVVEDLIMISDYFRMSIDTLLKVDLTKMSERSIEELQKGNDVFTSGTHLRVLATTIDKKNREQIEFVPKKARAGYTAGYSDPEFISALPSFNLPHLPQDRKFRMFPITGDSMLPVPDGALVIGSYIEDWNGIKDGTPCIVVTRNEGIVFKLVTNQIKKNRTLLMVSLNRVFDPYELPVEEVIEIWQFANYVTDKMPAPEKSEDVLARSVEEIKRDLETLLKRKGNQD